MPRGIDREPMSPEHRVGIVPATNAMRSYVRTGDWRAPYVRALLIAVGADPRSRRRSGSTYIRHDDVPVCCTTLSASERVSAYESITFASRATPLPLAPLAIMCPTTMSLLIPGSLSRGCRTLVARSRSKAGAHPLLP